MLFTAIAEAFMSPEPSVPAGRPSFEKTRTAGSFLTVTKT